MKKTYTVKDDFINSRLDRWFKKNICLVPQSLIEKSIRIGKIKVNEKRKKSSYKLNLKDQISLYDINFVIRDYNLKKNKYKPSKKD